MGTAKKAKYPIGFYICCITYTFERFAFYDEAKKVYAIIATGETALYANIMLQKGVVVD